MTQSKSQSLKESIAQVALGFVVSLGIWMYVVLPIWNLPVTMIDNIGITLIFTFSAIVRQYALRRWFNGKLLRS